MSACATEETRREAIVTFSGSEFVHIIRSLVERYETLSRIVKDDVTSAMSSTKCSKKAININILLSFYRRYLKLSQLSFYNVPKVSKLSLMNHQYKKNRRG